MKQDISKRKFILKYNPAYDQYCFVEKQAYSSDDDREVNEDQRAIFSKTIFRQGACNSIECREDLMEEIDIQTMNEVETVTPSQKMANLLKNLMFFQDGILTTHLSYLAQSWSASPSQKSVLLERAKAEDDALNTLGNLVVAYGGRPNFTTSNSKNWTIQYLILANDFNAFVREAIKTEQQAIREIESVIRQTENQRTIQSLQNIISEKQKTITALSTLTNLN